MSDRSEASLSTAPDVTPSEAVAEGAPAATSLIALPSTEDTSTSAAGVTSTEATTGVAPAAAATEAADPLLTLLRERFNLVDFRRGQREIIADVLAGRDTVAVMPTGGGKSLCYQLPALAKPGIAVVISPLISLMKDQTQALLRRGVVAGCLHSGQTQKERRAVFEAMQRSESFLLYLSPERVQQPRFAAWFKQAPVSLIAVDEAHCISQWGHDFRRDYAKLALLRRLRPEVPILALTATATPLVLDDIATTLGMSGETRHVYGFYRPNLFIQAEQCKNDEMKWQRLRAGVDLLRDEKADGRSVATTQPEPH
jgi:ATP-dependent DNA helicase RecQ